MIVGVEERMGDEEGELVRIDRFLRSFIITECRVMGR